MQRSVLVLEVCLTVSLSATEKKIPAQTAPKCTSMTFFFFFLNWHIDTFLMTMQIPQHSYTNSFTGSRSGHCAEGACVAGSA